MLVLAEGPQKKENTDKLPPDFRAMYGKVDIITRNIGYPTTHTHALCML
jgi:hypothetical protein